MAFREASHCSIQCSAIKLVENLHIFWSHKCSKMDVVRSISYIWCSGVRVLFVCFSCGHSNERMTSFAY